MFAVRDQESALEDYLGTLFAGGVMADVPAALAPAPTPVVRPAVESPAPELDEPLRVVRFRAGSMSFGLPRHAVKRTLSLADVAFAPGTAMAAVATWQGRVFDVIDILALVVPAAHPQRQQLLAQQQPKFLLLLNGNDGAPRGCAIFCDEWLGGVDVTPDQLRVHSDKTRYPWLAATFTDGRGALLDEHELIAGISTPNRVGG